jgi:hypothetical protein
MRKPGRPFLIHPSVQASLTQNCLKLTIAGFSHNLLPAFCGYIGFLNIRIGQVLAWIPGLKCFYCVHGPLQTV